MTTLDYAELLITPEQAARRLSIGCTKCYELIDIGIVPSVKIGRLRRVIAAELPSVVERLRQEDNSGQA
jgi:excisionase family DNA binding protein